MVEWLPLVHLETPQIAVLKGREWTANSEMDKSTLRRDDILTLPLVPSGTITLVQSRLVG